jgi:hypothetical protein
MKSLFLIIFIFVGTFCNSQEVSIELLEAKKNKKCQISLTLKIYNQSNKNYVINNNFTFQEAKPDFSLGTFVKFNLFEHDTINVAVTDVHFEKDKNKNYNSRKDEFFFIKSNSEEIINIWLDDFLSEAEKIGLKMKMIEQEDLSISLVIYQSAFVNIKKRKILSKMRKENSSFFMGKISTNKVHLN